jgi:hypothetical protein
MNIGKRQVRLVVLGIGLVLFAVVVGFDILYKPAQTFLAETSRSAMAHLSAVTAVSVACGFFPFLEGFSRIMDRILNFLLLSNLILLFQFILLEISRSWILKFALFAAVGLAFVPKLRKTGLRAALILALVNPGLSLYIVSVKVLAQDSTSRISGKISAELDTAEQGLPADSGTYQKDALEPSEQDRSGDIPAPEVRKALWEHVSETLGRMKSSLSSDSMARSYDLTKRMISGSLDRLLKLMLEYFVSTLLLFILLPFAYFYLLVGLFRRFLIPPE